MSTFGNLPDDLSEHFRKIQDVNELIDTARLINRENQPFSFPLEEEVAEDFALDMAYGFLSVWILWFSSAPIEGRKQVDGAIEHLIRNLQKIKASLSDDDESKKIILHGLKRQLIKPDRPLY